MALSPSLLLTRNSPNTSAARSRVRIRGTLPISGLNPSFSRSNGNGPNEVWRTFAMDVSQWMTKSVMTIKPKDTLRHARERLAKYRINQLPVVVNDKLVGIVTDRDVRDAYPSSLRLFYGKDIDEFGDSHTVEEVMTYNVVAISPQ